MIEEMLQPYVSERFANEPKYREGHIRIINALPGRRIMGLHMPDTKMVAKELAKREDAFEIIRGFEREAAMEADMGYGSRLTLEEILVWGIMISVIKTSWEDRAEMVRRHVPVMDSWAACDTFCCNAKWVKDYPDGPAKAEGKGICSRRLFWDFLQLYWRSKREFEVRFAVVMSMICFLDDEYFPKVCRMIDALEYDKIKSDYISLKEARIKGIPDPKGAQRGVALGERPYYVRMAVAWLLATALARLPEQTRSYVNSSRLPEDVKRLYVRKARESFRTRTVSPF